MLGDEAAQLLVEQLEELARELTTSNERDAQRERRGGDAHGNRSRQA
jgi:hypothetical protein